MNLEPTGQLTVRKALAELNQMIRSKAPFLLTVIAEEIGTLPYENNTQTSINVAIMIEDETNDAPKFNQER